MTEADISWAAGLYEGEGSIVTGTARFRSLRLTMGSVDPDVLEKLMSVIGGVLNGPYRQASMKAHHKSMWRWQLSGAVKTQAVLRLFWPYLGERRKQQAANALAHYYELGSEK